MLPSFHPAIDLANELNRMMHDDDCAELQLIALQVEIDVLGSIYHETGNHYMSIDLNQLLMGPTRVSLNPFGFLKIYIINSDLFISFYGLNQFNNPSFWRRLPISFGSVKLKT